MAAPRLELLHAYVALVQVAIGGGDTTQDHTLEVYKPPYLSKGNQPKLLAAPKSVSAGDAITATVRWGWSTALC